MTNTPNGHKLPSASSARYPFGPGNVLLVKTAGETRFTPGRHDDGNLHLPFVDGFEGLVILAVDPTFPVDQRSLAAASRAATPAPSRLRHHVQRILSFLQ
jgi:hypothetical protein